MFFINKRKKILKILKVFSLYLITVVINFPRKFMMPLILSQFLVIMKVFWEYVQIKKRKTVNGLKFSIFRFF